MKFWGTVLLFVFKGLLGEEGRYFFLGCCTTSPDLIAPEVIVLLQLFVFVKILCFNEPSFPDGTLKFCCWGFLSRSKLCPGFKIGVVGGLKLLCETTVAGGGGRKVVAGLAGAPVGGLYVVSRGLKGGGGGNVGRNKGEYGAGYKPL